MWESNRNQSANSWYLIQLIQYFYLVNVLFQEIIFIDQTMFCCWNTRIGIKGFMAYCFDMAFMNQEF